MATYNAPRKWYFPTHGGGEEGNHGPRPFADGGRWPRPDFNGPQRPCGAPFGGPLAPPRQPQAPGPGPRHRPDAVGPRQFPPPSHGWPRSQCRPPPHGPLPPFSERQRSIPVLPPQPPRPRFPPPPRPEPNANQYANHRNVLPVPTTGDYRPAHASASYHVENGPCHRGIKIERVGEYNSALPNPPPNDYPFPANTAESYYGENVNSDRAAVPCLVNIKLDRDPMFPNPPPSDHQFPVYTSENYGGGYGMNLDCSSYNHNVKLERVQDYNQVVPTAREYQYPVGAPIVENNYSRNMDGRDSVPCLLSIKLDGVGNNAWQQLPTTIPNEYHIPVNSSVNNARDGSSLHHSTRQQSIGDYEPVNPVGANTSNNYSRIGEVMDGLARTKYESDSGYNSAVPFSSNNDQPLPRNSSLENSRDKRNDEDSLWERKRPLPKDRLTPNRTLSRRSSRPPSHDRERREYRKEDSRPPSRSDRRSSESDSKHYSGSSVARERRTDSSPKSRASDVGDDSGRKGGTPRRDSERAKTSRSRESSSSRRSRSKSSSRRSRSKSILGGECKKSRSETPKRNARRSPNGRESEARRSASRKRSSERPKEVAPTEGDGTPAPSGTGSERENLLQKYRKNYCANSTDVMQSKLQELAKMTPDQVIEQEKKVWTRTAPADLFYARDQTNQNVICARPKLVELCATFKRELVDRAEAVRTSRPRYDPPPRKDRSKMAKHKSEVHSSSDSSSGGGESSTDEEDCTMEEMERKRLHPHRLHQELWFNDAGEMNDGPLCRCSARARRCGIRHGIYAGERHLLKCRVDSNNADRLKHYRITISPPTNFLTKTPTIINHDEHEFIFEGFSMFSHFPLEKLPTCKVIRFNIEYTILYIEEKIPENFTIRELDLFHDYLFREILELVDLDFKAFGDSTGCSQFHFMPRFVRDLPDNGKEILSMNEVLQYLLNSNRELIQEPQLKDLLEMPQYKWQNFADEIKGMVVTYPGVKPCALRVDQLDRNQQGKKKCDNTDWPEIVHFGIRPPQLSYAGNPDYQKAWREYVKYRHLIANMPKPSFEDKRKLEAKENKLQEMRTLSKMKRDVTVAVASRGFYCTGIMCDLVQHAMLIPVLVCHLRFHRSCDVLEADIGYRFDNRYLLQLALTHPSYRENFGTNPDHARNSLTNCGIRQPEYGDRRIHYMNTRKRGINTLINIMSRFGKKTETESNITHNERLEFLGDAVVEFLTSIHLFHMFPDLEEGGLATYRAAIVQNQHLAVLAKRLKLEEFMLYAHGSDLCHDLELRHAMANCFEALMGALFLDGGIEVADKVFGETLFKENPDLLDVWVNYPPHPLQEQEPLGDRKWIPHFELLQKLTEFEKTTDIEFTHIRLLARAFTDRSIGYTNLTLGSNQRLEFLGDTVLQLIASEYLYKFFPEHHEGHLSLLRSSLVNNRTQAVVCDDLAMTNYALYANPKGELKTKDRADLLEAFLGALYVDQDLEFCHVFCHVCFFPRLQDFIMNQDWNDPKSKLQQCCLTLRTMDGGEPDIPIYKVIECKGPTNTRVYTVAVYFQSRRLASASGHSIQQAEMNAAKKALDLSQELFPQLDHQKRVIAKSMKKQKWPNRTILRGRPTKPSTDRERRQNLEEC